MEVESVKGERETTGGARGRFRCDGGGKCKHKFHPLMVFDESTIRSEK